MRNYARFIPGEEIQAAELWNFGAIDTTAQLLEAQAKARASEQDQVDLATACQDSRQAGYAAGLIQGRAQAEAELQQKMADFLDNQAQAAAQHFGALFATTQSQLAAAQQTMAQGVLELSCELARQVMRQELSVNPNVLLPVIAEALDMLGAEHRSAVVRMNPADLEVLGGLMPSEFTGMALTLRADPALQPGGCVVESAGMVVDATLQKRWQRAVATLGLESSWEGTSEPS
ncbi:MAG: FliH/SctL family protein [Rhodoferax sp.]|uniref:FliH/SctL family protein n=1 Tax=Rhodoferax sp. TaxID=50421 RepID=UPI00262A8B07|nr:FliH/SctL family protein [Rhodoferax sp.]MDD2880972.1 FliH/SctL family protein [Rhodoferax sp.]